MSIKNDYIIIHKGASLFQYMKDFILKWHYSETYRSMKQVHIFNLIHKSGKLHGICVYGQPISRHENEAKTIELRKLCLIDETPKNTESFFIAKTIKWLKKNTDYFKVISYSDPNIGHEGTIYKASNFNYLGFTEFIDKVLLLNGKSFHKRQVYQKKDGKYMKSSLVLQGKIKSGDANWISLLPKHKYEYLL